MGTNNTWPDGYRHAISQKDHDEWNRSHYPGTRQLCVKCDGETGRCEDDEIYVDEIGPLCPDCFWLVDDKEGEA